MSWIRPALLAVFVLLPFFTCAQQNGIDVYRQALNQLDYESYQADYDTIAQMLGRFQTNGNPVAAKWVARATPLFALIAQGNAAPEVSYPPIVWEGPGKFPLYNPMDPKASQANWEQNMIDWARAQAMGNLICLYALQRAEQGEWDAALRAWEASLAFASRICAENSLVNNKLAAIPIYRHNVECIGRSMDAGFPDPKLYSRVYTMLQEHPLDRWSIAVAMRGEAMVQRLTISGLYEVIMDPPAELLAAAPPEEIQKAQMMQKVLPPTIDEFLQQYDAFWTQVIAKQNAPFAEFKQFDPMQEADKYNPLLKMAMGNFMHARLREDEVVARARMVQLEAALRWHHAQNGQLPASLSDLSITAEMPLDPFTNQPFQYTVRQVSGADGAQILSPGPNLVNDGGNQQWDQSSGIHGPGDIFQRFRLR